jgi:hypothetical protein
MNVTLVLMRAVLHPPLISSPPAPAIYSVFYPRFNTRCDTTELRTKDIVFKM